MYDMTTLRRVAAACAPPWPNELCRIAYLRPKFQSCTEGHRAETLRMNLRMVPVVGLISGKIWAGIKKWKKKWARQIEFYSANSRCFTDGLLLELHCHYQPALNRKANLTEYCLFPKITYVTKKNEHPKGTRKGLTLVGKDKRLL